MIASTYYSVSNKRICPAINFKSNFPKNVFTENLLFLSHINIFREKLFEKFYGKIIFSKNFNSKFLKTSTAPRGRNGIEYRWTQGVIIRQ